MNWCESMATSPSEQKNEKNPFTVVAKNWKEKTNVNFGKRKKTNGKERKRTEKNIPNIMKNKKRWPEKKEIRNRWLSVFFGDSFFYAETTENGHNHALWPMNVMNGERWACVWRQTSKMSTSDEEEKKNLQKKLIEKMEKSTRERERGGLP